MLDEELHHIGGFFLKKNNYLKTKVMKLMFKLKEKSSVQIKHTKCGNMSKHMLLKKLCKLEGLGIEFEYTAPGMPQ